LPHGDLRILLHRRETIHPANIPIRLSLESRNLCVNNHGCSHSGHPLVTYLLRRPVVFIGNKSRYCA
jgi:hypothetical protein